MRRTSPARFSRSRRSAESSASTARCSWSTRPNRWATCRSTCRELEVDLLAAPGHKGLLGPLGTGVLYIRRGVERELTPLRYGGTGTRSDEDRQPDELPDKYEPGNHNLPGLGRPGRRRASFSRESRSQRFTPITRALTARLLERLARDRRSHRSRPAVDGPSHERRQHHGRRLRSAGTRRGARMRRTASNAAPASTAPRGCTRRSAPPQAAARSASAPATRRRSTRSMLVAAVLEEVASVPSLK